MKQKPGWVLPDLKEAQKQFLTKEDFIREQRKTENKLDEIYKLLLKERV